MTEENTTKKADSVSKSELSDLLYPLIDCRICGRSPASYSCGSQYKGCNITVWAVECDHSEEDEPFPFVEHRLTVYGTDRQEAESRWNDINRV